MTPYRFHRQAAAEFAAAAQHYAAISPALGQRFYLTMQDLLDEICSAPACYRMILPPARRHFRLPFPCAVRVLRGQVGSTARKGKPPGKAAAESAAAA